MTTPHTESATEISERVERLCSEAQTVVHDPDFAVYAKAKLRGEKLFCLRSQDVTAHLAVKFWVKVQQKVRAHMDAGLTMTQAVEAVSTYYFLDCDVPASDAKLTEALRIAEAMQRHTNRKLAD